MRLVLWMDLHRFGAIIIICCYDVQCIRGRMTLSDECSLYLIQIVAFSLNRTQSIEIRTSNDLSSFYKKLKHRILTCCHGWPRNRRIIENDVLDLYFSNDHESNFFRKFITHGTSLIILSPCWKKSVFSYFYDYYYYYCCCFFSWDSIYINVNIYIFCLRVYAYSFIRSH